jgi:hypothetical protein
MGAIIGVFGVAYAGIKGGLLLHIRRDSLEEESQVAWN